MGIQMNRYSSMLTNWQDDRRIFKRLAKEYKEKSDYIDGYTESVKAVITNASNMKKFSVCGKEIPATIHHKHRDKTA